LQGIVPRGKWLTVRHHLLGNSARSATMTAVFRWEMLQAGRRGRGYFLRWIYGVFLLVQIVPIFYLSDLAWDRLLTQGNVHTYFDSFLTQHFTLLALLTPAVVGGAITEEKARGTLASLLASRLDSDQIVIGKLLAHSYQLVLWSLVGLPVLGFLAGSVGDVAMPAVVIGMSLVLAFGIAGLSILFSTWIRTTGSAILCTYLTLGLAVLLVSSLAEKLGAAWLLSFNPLRVFSLDDPTLAWRHLGATLPVFSLDDPAVRWGRFGGFVAAWLLLGLCCVLVASRQLRWAYQRHFHVRQRVRSRDWLAKLLRSRTNRVLWREQGFGDMSVAPHWSTILAVMLVSATVLGCLLIFLRALAHEAWPQLLADPAYAFFWQGLAAFLVLTLVVIMRSASSVTQEREGGTWLALMVTPLTTEEIIVGKYRGIFWDCVPYVAAHAAVTMVWALCLGYWPVRWTLFWIGFMVLSLILSGAFGLWWGSARSAHSWRSALATLTLTYFMWFLLLWPLGVWSMLVDTGNMAGGPMASAATGVLSWAVCFGVGVALCIFLPPRLLGSAVVHVSRTDRWEMDFDSAPSNLCQPKEEETWEAPRFDDVQEKQATLASAESQGRHMMMLVKSREMDRAIAAELRGDRETAARHFLAAAYLELVLAADYDGDAQFDLALRSRKNAASCFWRAGQVAQARELLAELKRENRFLASEIDEMVLGLEQNNSVLNEAEAAAF
jgi:ABC-type transport system involved in multi-copper enzyme maturation permease subunit